MKLKKSLGKILGYFTNENDNPGSAALFREISLFKKNYHLKGINRKFRKPVNPEENGRH